MAKFNSLQSSFSSGMVSPKFNGRSDLDIYNSAVEELLNMSPTPEGGVRTRETFISLGMSSYGNDNSIKRITLIPFIDSTGACYIIQLKATSSSALSLEIFLVDATKIAQGYFDPISSVSYSYGYEANTILAAGDSEIQWAYVGDTVILTSGVVEPIIIYRFVDSFTTFKISTLSMYPVENYVGATYTKILDASKAMGFPSKEVNTDPNKLLTGVQSIASTSTDHAIWKLNIKNAAGTTLALWDVTKTTYITITNSSYTAIFKTIGSYGLNTTSDMYAYLIYSYGTVSITNVKSWSISIWDNVNGFPKCVSFYNNRLILGSTKKYPSSYWASFSGKIYRFHDIILYEDKTSDVSGLTTTNDEGQTTSSFPLLQGGTSFYSTIKWHCSGVGGLYVGTSNGVELLTPGTTGVLSISNNSTTLLTNEGASSVQPVSFSGNLIYVARDGKRIIMLTSEGKSTDLTALNSEYLSKFSYSEVVTKLVVNDTDSTIIVATNYNHIFYIRLNAIEGKWGMSKIEIANIKHTGNVGLGICCINLIWPTIFISGVLQNITTGNAAGNAYSFLCYSNKTVEVSSRDIESCALDLAMRYKAVMYDSGGNPTNVINGKIVTLFLGHFAYGAGLNVFELTAIYQATDNTWVKDVYPVGSFSGFHITLSKTPLSDVMIGFAFDQDIKTLDLNFKNSDYGTNFAAIKRLDHVNFRVYNSLGFSFSDSINSSEEKLLVSETDQTNFSGTVELSLQSSPERESRVLISGLKGYPLHISSLVYKGLSSE